MKQTEKFFATCPPNIETLLLNELNTLGVHYTKETKGGVFFQGTMDQAYRCCLWSRLANRILMELHCFDFQDADDLYEGVSEIEWSNHLNLESSLAVTFSGSHPAITHTQFGAQKVKDAVVDHFQRKYGRRPDVDLIHPDVRINAHVHTGVATISLDLSGESLHRRGYRLEAGKAPLKENLAAAILIRAGWPEMARDLRPFIDPMCGSGTLLIEAAMLAADVAPGLSRHHFGFQTWAQYQSGPWFELLNEADERRKKGLEQLPQISGADVDKRMVDIALGNIHRAGLEGSISIEHQSITQMRPQGMGGLICTNPPYGERLGDENTLIALYRDFGDVLRNEFVGWKVAVLTGNPELAFKLGIRARQGHNLKNGGIECKLLRFDVTQERFFTPHEGGARSEEERERDGVLRAAQRLDASSPGVEMLANRLKKNYKILGKWARANDVACFRLYDADLPEYAVAIDVYGSLETFVVVQEYEAPPTIDADKAKKRLIEALAAVMAVLEVPAERIRLKVRRRNRGQQQYEKASETGCFYSVVESGLKFWVNFDDYIDTGIFLDHRPIRSFIRERALGKRFLNLFSYTGSASVYAAAGGASQTTSVDMSKTYLDWAKRNFEVNGFSDQDKHAFQQANCIEWLRAAVDLDVRYDLIFLDPPTFSVSKRMEKTLDIQRDYVSIIKDCLSIMSPDGTLIFSTNNRRFKLDVEALGGVEVMDYSKQSIPKDFERNPRIHYCWLIRFPED